MGRELSWAESRSGMVSPQNVAFGPQRRGRRFPRIAQICTKPPVVAPERRPSAEQLVQLVQGRPKGCEASAYRLSEVELRSQGQLPMSKCGKIGMGGSGDRASGSRPRRLKLFASLGLLFLLPLHAWFLQSPSSRMSPVCRMPFPCIERADSRTSCSAISRSAMRHISPGTRAVLCYPKQQSRGH